MSDFYGYTGGNEPGVNRPGFFTPIENELDRISDALDSSISQSYSDLYSETKGFNACPGPCLTPKNNPNNFFSVNSTRLVPVL